MSFKGIIEKIKSNEDLADLKTASVRDFLNGNIFLKNFFRKQYPLLILIAVLTFLYIGNRYAYEKQLDRYIEMTNHLQELKYESLTVSSDLMKMGRQSNVRKLLIDSPLKEGKNPTIILEKKK